MEIIGKNGIPKTEYDYKGETFVESCKGEKYSIRLHNDSPYVILFVPSVDGLSVINGEEASKNSGGYLIRPWGSLNVPGWRLNDKEEEVTHFCFDSIPQVYASQMGTPNNIGVIGAIIYYEEKQKLTPFKFERADSPTDRMIIRYDYYEGLKGRGIQVVPEHQRNTSNDRIMAADPFPGDKDCRPPERWTE
ncbi:MAG: hypothetical protein PHX30_03810 [Candidatus Pacebacteria bacterium]|nr:hypothetical protein [Candidatus Paceibacterota bacterium]